MLWRLFFFCNVCYLFNSIMQAELFCFNWPGPRMKCIGVNLHFLQFVHRSETSSLNVLKTTAAHKSNKIIIMLKKDSWIRLEEYFQNVFPLKDVTGYKQWNHIMDFIFINLWRGITSPRKRTKREPTHEPCCEIQQKCLKLKQVQLDFLIYLCNNNNNNNNS